VFAYVASFLVLPGAIEAAVRVGGRDYYLDLPVQLAISLAWAALWVAPWIALVLVLVKVWGALSQRQNPPARLLLVAALGGLVAMGTRMEPGASAVLGHHLGGQLYAVDDWTSTAGFYTWPFNDGLPALLCALPAAWAWRCRRSPAVLASPTPATPSVQLSHCVAALCAVTAPFAVNWYLADRWWYIAHVGAGAAGAVLLFVGAIGIAGGTRGRPAVHRFGVISAGLGAICSGPLAVVLGGSPFNSEYGQLSWPLTRTSWWLCSAACLPPLVMLYRRGSAKRDLRQVPDRP
jgi:hypothetical protein